MELVNLVREKLLGGLLFLLFCFNASVAALALTLAPRVGSFSWDAGDPFSYFFNSRDMGNVAGIMVASAVLSIGVYFFVQTCLVLRDEEAPSPASSSVAEAEQGATGQSAASDADLHLRSD